MGVVFYFYQRLRMARGFKRKNRIRNGFIRLNPIFPPKSACYPTTEQNQRKMNIEQLQQYCLNKEDAEETFPFGPDTLVYKVNGKVFLLAGLDQNPVRFNAKCDPDRAVELREEYPDNVLPGFHMNKKHWNTVVANANIPSKLLRDLIDHSYELVRGKKKRS
jgi:predicted DNA-binding protein (MmcQ/YjbR family)